MLDHIGIPVSDYAQSKEFYRRILEPLGYELLKEFGEVAGFGREGKPAFWIGLGSPYRGLHVAFLSPDKTSVDAFYETAVAAGAQDNGAPGLRPQYHPGYYGAFIIDANGYNLEAVYHHKL